MVHVHQKRFEINNEEKAYRQEQESAALRSEPGTFGGKCSLSTHPAVCDEENAEKAEAKGEKEKRSGVNYRSKLGKKYLAGAFASFSLLKQVKRNRSGREEAGSV